MGGELNCFHIVESKPCLPTKLERYKGCLLGLAAGDALGVTLISKPGSFQLLTGMIGGGPFNLKPGEWTTTHPWLSALQKAIF